MTAEWTSCVDAIVAAVTERVGGRGTVEVDAPPDDPFQAVYVDLTPRNQAAAELNLVIDDAVLTFMVGQGAMAEFRARGDEGCDEAMAHVIRYVDAVVAGGLVEESWWRADTLVRIQVRDPHSDARLASWGWPARPRIFFDERRVRTYEPY